MQSLTKQSLDGVGCGAESGGRFSIPVHINYEDTDAGGVVYYGNYLGYMERARNAFLRHRGYPLSSLAEEHHILFVVKQAHIEYHLPAKLDDVLQVTLMIERLSGASIFFHHEVLRGTECLVDGKIKLATLNKHTFRPTRIPKSLCANLIN